MAKRMVALVTWLAIASGTAAGESQPVDPADAMSEQVTCAVFYRVITGAMLSRDKRTEIDMTLVAKQYREAMEAHKREALASARLAYGDELGDEIFTDAWRDTYNEMIESIDGNYRKLSQLKYRYGERCGYSASPRFE